jgi:hypothetical protein
MIQFPLDDYRRFLSISKNLLAITFRGIGTDATLILSRVCRECSIIRDINITHVQYISDFEKVSLPSTIVQLTISSSAFSDTSFASLLDMIGMSMVNRPFLFVAQN